MVAKDENNQPVQVPGLILESREQVRRFLEARSRKELKNNYKQEADKAVMPEEDERWREMLKGERCTIAN